MTKEEARNVFGGSIVNKLLWLGAEPTNVVRRDGLIERWQDNTKGNGRLICVAIPSLVMRRPVSWDELKK